VLKQAQASPGNVSARLGGNPLRNNWETVTVWEDRASMEAFMRSEPHLTAMRNMPRWASPKSVLTDWEATDPEVTKAEAHRHLRDGMTYAERRKS
jgi:hypothetical protein